MTLIKIGRLADGGDFGIDLITTFKSAIEGTKESQGKRDIMQMLREQEARLRREKEPVARDKKSPKIA